jgi:hypothetical protein
MQLRNPKDFWAGVMFMVVGFAFAIIVKAYEYPMGTGSRMGPGYFPFVLGIIMGFLGMIVVAISFFTSGGPVSKFAWRPLIWVLSAVVIFGLTAKLIGLFLAIIVLVMIASYGGHEFRWKEQLIASLILATGSVLVFKVGLKLPFNVWPAFLS